MNAAIKHTKHTNIFRYSMVLSLVTVSYAYGVESPKTPGPSVGHRPVINGLILATGSGDITKDTTTLGVGETISRTGGSINDVDGDPVEAGEYCVWYRVDPNTHLETVVKDPGTTDRNCAYTIQATDVGFKIKNVIKVFSAPAIANSFTVNPAVSWPKETISAKSVILKPIAANSAINLASDIVSGDDMSITVKLNDASNNPVKGALSLLTKSTIVVENAIIKPGSQWVDNNDGSYTIIYIAQSVGVGMKVSLTLPDWSYPLESSPYEIKTGWAGPQEINVNGYNFGWNSGFPQTGFIGAKFRVIPKGNVSASSYNWSTSAPSWTSVNNGEVVFTNTGDKNTVTIKAVPKNGIGRIITWKFNLKTWFINDGNRSTNWQSASNFCSSRSYVLPSMTQLLGGTSNAKRGMSGGLWGEWGNLQNYNAGFISDYYYSSTKLPGYQWDFYNAHLSEGWSYSWQTSYTRYVVCSKNL